MRHRQLSLALVTGIVEAEFCLNGFVYDVVCLQLILPVEKVPFVDIIELFILLLREEQRRLVDEVEEEVNQFEGVFAAVPQQPRHLRIQQA